MLVISFEKTAGTRALKAFYLKLKEEFHIRG